MTAWRRLVGRVVGLLFRHRVYHVEHPRGGVAILHCTCGGASTVRYSRERGLSAVVASSCAAGAWFVARPRLAIGAARDRRS